MIDRRDLFKLAAAGLLLPPALSLATSKNGLRERLLAAQASPVLRRERLGDPIVIESVELLRRDDQFFVRVRSKDGAEGIALTNRNVVRHIYPLLATRVMPRFCPTSPILIF